MRLGHIELFCLDTSITKRFFVEGLGFDLVVEQPGGFVWLHSGPIEILLRPNLLNENRALSYQRATQALVIYAENLTEAKTRLNRAGIQILGTDGTDDCLTFQDPDGHWFQLVEHQ